MKLAVIEVAFAVLLSACLALPDLNLDTCNNFTVEVGEDCDGVDIAPAVCRECRLICETGQCPVGWRCGLDHRCRIESGTFSLEGSVVDSNHRLQCGDFDGDGTADLLLSAETSLGLVPTVAHVAFFGDAGLGPVATIPSVAPPAIVDVDGDGAADLAFISSNAAAPNSSGLSVLRGLPSHRFEPSLFSNSLGGSQGWPVTVSVPQPTTLAFRSSGNATQLVTLSGTMLASWAHSGVLGPVSTGRFDDSAQCEVVALAFANESAFHVKQLCVKGLVDPTAPDELVALSEPLVVPPQVLDLNADHHLDVLAITESAAMVFFGDGQGHFGSPVRLVLTVDGGDKPSLRSLLAHATDAGGTTFLLADAIIHVPPATALADTWVAQAQVLVRRPLGSWKVGLGADLNADGVADFAASSADGSSLDLFLWVDGRYSQKTITTLGSVAAVSSGDFDGDGIADLVWVERDADDRLEVAFGQAKTFPLNEVEVARAARFARLHAGALGNSGARLMAVLPGSAGEADRLAIWSNDGRVLTTLAPLFDLATSALGVSVLAGDFGGSHRSVAVAGLDVSTASNVDRIGRWWSVELEGGTAKASAPLSTGSFYSLSSQGSPIINVSGVAGNLDDVATDELVTLSAPPGAPGALLTISSLVNGVFVSGSQVVSALDFTPDARSQLLLLELTGDQHLDLVVLAKGANDQRVLLLCPSVKADRCVSLAIDGSPQAIATLHARLGPSLAVLTNSGLLYATRTTGALEFRQVPQVAGGVGLAIGDSNGDGLDDLFVSNGATVNRYLSIGAHQ